MQAEYEIIVIVFSFLRRSGSEDWDRGDHSRFVPVQRRRNNRADSRAPSETTDSFPHRRLHSDADLAGLVTS